VDKKTYWLFAVWENSRGIWEALRFHTNIAFDPRELKGEDAEHFAAEILRAAGVRSDQVMNQGAGVPSVRLEIFDNEAECSARYTKVRTELGIVVKGRDKFAGSGRYGRTR